MARAFKQTREEWAATNGWMTQADGAARTSEMQGYIDADRAAAQSAADEGRTKLDEAKVQSEAAQAQVQQENEQLANDLKARAEASDADRTRFAADHDPGGPKSSADAQREFDELSDDKLNIYNEYVNPDDDTFTSTDDQIAEGGTAEIDPTKGVSELSDEDLQKEVQELGANYDPYADMPSSEDSGSGSKSSTAGMTRADVVHLDMPLLRDLANRCAQINEAFQKGTASDQSAAWYAGTRTCLGYNSGLVNGVIKEFYSNWKIRRGKIRESAEQYGKNARIVEQNFTRLDVEIAAKAVRQRAVFLESKRRALAASESRETPEGKALTQPELDLYDGTVEFIGMKSGISLTGAAIGAKLALQVEGAASPYAASAGDDFGTGDFTPDAVFTTPDPSDLSDPEKCLDEGTAQTDYYRSDGFEPGRPGSPGGIPGLIDLATTLIGRRGGTPLEYPDGTMHVVLAGPRGMVPRAAFE